jgi:hypothetical protein
MRSLHDAFCEVCGEAIVQGVYGRVALIDYATPTSPAALDSKSPLTLSITHPVPNPNTLQVSWTVDGLAVSAEGDALTLPAGALKPGTHEIRVRLADATPLVRMGRGRLEQVHTWTVTIGGEAPPAAASVKAPDQHLLLRVVRDGSGFRVAERQVVSLPLPAEPGQGSHAWQVQALDSEGQALLSQGLEDPELLRGEFQNAADRGRMDGYRLKGTRLMSFLVRMPMTTARLELFEGVQDGGVRRPLGGVALGKDLAP